MKSQEPRVPVGLRKDGLPAGAKIIEASESGASAEVQGRDRLEIRTCPYCGQENTVAPGFGLKLGQNQFLMVRCRRCDQCFYYS